MPQPSLLFDRDRLIRLLHRLTSTDDDQQVIGAARSIKQLLDVAGITWTELLNQEPSASKRFSTPTNHSLAARACLKSKARLTEWEITFLEGIQHATRISEDQERSLERCGANTRSRWRQSDEGQR